MVSASTENLENDKTTFRDELQRSVLVRMNPELPTAIQLTSNY